MVDHDADTHGWLCWSPVVYDSGRDACEPADGSCRVVQSLMPCRLRGCDVWNLCLGLMLRYRGRVFVMD